MDSLDPIADFRSRSAGDPHTSAALDVQTLDLDCGYDINISTERCETLGLTDIVCAVKRGKGEHQTLDLGPWLARRTSASSAAETDTFIPQRLG